jgi:uncharacterized RDD family membrane protein YckC
MSFVGDSPRQSVAPPGWTPSPEFAPLPSAATAPTPAVAVQGADAAVRWRLRAARIDNVIVTVAYLGVCALMHWRVASVGHLWVLGLTSIAYHFALEARGGQTIGKKRCGIQVVAVDGAPASVRAVAIRSVLRVIDQLPVSYVSGLISMVRTGPARRQRIGDVAAGTIVIAVDGRAASQGTPGWFLPVATLFAVAVSAFYAVAVFEAGKQPLNGVERAEFVAGCQNSPMGAYADCQCFLNRLEADGYDTLNSLRDLESQSQAEVASGQRGTARTEVENAFAACRR